MRKFLFIVLLISSCQKEPIIIPDIVDIEEFTKVDNSSILVSLKPTAAMDYVELRLSTGQGPMGDEFFTVRESFGDKTKLTGTCLDFLNNLPIQEDGFAKGCRPMCYFHYLVTAKDNEVKIYNQPNTVLQFLGDIDSEADAILYAFANGYEFDYNDKAAAGIRKTITGYQLLAKKLVRSCSPIQWNQVWLHISKKGTITIQKEVLYSTLDACM